MSAPKKRNFFSNALDAMIDSRSRQAKAYVNGALLMLDDETLKAHGYKREDLAKRRSAPSVF